MGGHAPQVAVALVGFPFFGLLLYAMMPAHRAAIATALTGWLFLPEATFHFTGFPEYSKFTAIILALLLGLLLYDGHRLLRTTPRWFDAVPLVLVVTPFISSVMNGMGVYNGLSAAFSATVSWMIPYVVGRVQLQSRGALMDVAIGVFMAGLVYIPLCLFEIRMSPKLDVMIYGQSTAGWGKRYGGWRPDVFLKNGLVLGLFMSAACLCGFWVWRSKAYPRIFGVVPTGLALAALVVTTILCKSAGALGLGLVVFAAGLGARWFRSAWPLALTGALPVLFVILRASGMWSAEGLVDLAEDIFGPDRAGSLNTRVVNDTQLAEKARQRLFFGWDGYGRNRIVNEQGRDVSLTDSKWVIQFGTAGAVGLTAFLAFLIIPLWRLPGKVARSEIRAPMGAGPMAAASLVLLWCMDMLFNAFSSPIYIAAVGGLAALPARAQVTRRRTAPGQSNYSTASPRTPHTEGGREQVLARRASVKGG